MKSLKEFLNIDEGYNYNKNNFNPSDCLTWLIKTGKIEKYKGQPDDPDEIGEYAEQAQHAAEDEGIPTLDAERVYDVCYDRFGTKLLK